jgi:hypothetical protein
VYAQKDVEEEKGTYGEIPVRGAGQAAGSSKVASG